MRRFLVSATVATVLFATRVALVTIAVVIERITGSRPPPAP